MIHLQALAPMLPSVSPSDVRMPSRDAARDSRGRLLPAAAAAWDAGFAPVIAGLARGVKEKTKKTRWGRVDLFNQLNQFLIAAGFGPFFVETSPGSGEWRPDVGDDGKMVRVTPACMAFFLATMANGGEETSRNEQDEMVLVGARPRGCAQRARRGALRQRASCCSPHLRTRLSIS